MGDIKNPFNFGTGDIDKDQWLKDIDNEYENFVSRYSSAVNKHRAALLLLAFLDLRRRIVNGDMLSRTADGLYQFGSALNREDKHMQEAYQRALGFMGDLARRQINKSVEEPEKKKYSTKILNDRFIKYFNPSGSKESFTSLWNSFDDATRKSKLLEFLRGELNTGLNNYLDVEDYESMDNLKLRINEFLATSDISNLNRLGFAKNYLNALTSEEENEEEPKSELEQVLEDLTKALESKLVLLGRLYLAFNNNRGQLEFNFTTPQFDLNYQLQHLLTTPQEMGSGPGFAPSGPSSDVLRRAATSRYIGDMLKELDNYFKNFATAWKPLYNNGEDSQRRIGEYLSKLFSTYSKSTNTNETPISDYTFDWKKYFTLIGLNQFLINGSIDNQTGRYAYYIPGEGIKEDNILDNPNQFVALKLGYTIPSLKEGGKVEFLQSGGGFDYDAWAASQEEPKSLVTNKPHQTLTPKLESSSFSTAENARIAATIADIASMGTAFVPGYGTAASAVFGLGSTATNFGADLADGQGLWDATKNAGFGLASDIMGLIPGLGGIGKGAKVARNLMWAVPKMMQWVNTVNGLSNAGEIKNSIMKLTSPSSMTLQDWLNVSQALQIMTGHGRSVATKIKKAGMSKTTTTTDPEYYIFTNKGKQKVSDETFNKLKETRGTKARQALTLELMGEGITLLQTRFAPWNTSTRFGAFKEVPGKTKVEVQNKHKGWFSDENLVEKAENFNPSVDIRSIISRVNPYRAYYNNRVPKSSPLPEYLQRPVDILPQGFGMTKSGMESAGFNMNPKRKGLTEAQKAARRQKAADKKSKEKAKKELEELRRNQGYALAEEVPQAGTYADIKRKLQDVTNLSNRYANEVELPIPTPRPTPGPRSEAFNKKYERSIGKKEAGGILKALRNGGIIKAAKGVQLSLNAGSWYNDVFSNYKDRIISQLNLKDPYDSVEWLNSMQGKHALIYKLAGSNFYDTAYKSDAVKSYQQEYDFGGGFFDKDFLHGFNDPGIAPAYNNRYIIDGKRISGDNLKSFTTDGLYSAITDDRRLLGRKGDWDDAKALQEFNDSIKSSGYRLELDTNDDYYKLRPFSTNGSSQPTQNTVDEGGKNGVDKEIEGKTVITPQFKNPTDPTPWIIAGKTTLGLMGNRNIYKNLLDEMPLAPLRDPINRQLAIVGWLELIKQGQNQLADLRNATWMQHGSDQLTNLAGMHEVENKGRSIMDDKYMKDSGRLFDTAQKLWNLKNEDVLYNARVGDENRKSVADRARMMAQIRAAWRSGDNNILMGALSDTGNWLMKKYQREQDIIDKSKELALGTPEEQAQASLQNDTEYSRIMNKHAAGQTLTDEEKAYVRRKQAEALKDIRGKFAQSYYGTYHSPWFGGGYREQILKDGGSLEKEKLRARGKDNDRYVSMIKDLRHTTYRRRRRR